MSLEDNLSARSISSFASPSDQLITLTLGQLQDLFKEAVREAIQPLQAEVSELQATVDRQQAEMADLRAKMASLEAAQDNLADNQLIQLRLINELRDATKKEPQPLQKDRSEILRALLAANGGKMLAKVARQKMHLPKNRFSELLDNCAFLECKPLHSDRRKMIIILKSELVPRN